MDVEIEYCVPCGHLDRAQHTAHRLLDTHGRRLDTVTLRTGHGGVSIVRADGEPVWDAAADGYDLDAITDRITRRLPA